MSSYNFNFDTKTTYFSNISADNVTADSLTADNMTLTNLSVEDLNITNDLFVSGQATIVDDLLVEGNIDCEDPDPMGIITGRRLIANEQVLTASLVSNGLVKLNSGNVDVETGDIVVQNGHISCSGFDNDAYVSAFQMGIDSTPGGANGNVSYRVLDQRLNYDWVTGVGPGVDTLEFDLSDLNALGATVIKFDVSYYAHTPANTNYLYMQLNNKTTNLYKTRITQNSSGLVDNNSQPHWNWLEFQSAGSDRIGNGSFTLYISKAFSSSPSMTGTFCSSGPTAAESVQNYKGGWVMNDSDGNQIDKITIDVSDNNHTGWNLYLRMYAMH